MAAYGTAPTEEPPTPLLVVNLRERRVTYRGHKIPTKPPNNIRRQPLLALADGMFKLGSLRKRPTSPDARDLRYKLLRPFKKVLGGRCLLPRSISSSSPCRLTIRLQNLAIIVRIRERKEPFPADCARKDLFTSVVSW